MPVLKGNTSFYDYEVSDILAVNIQERLKYGFLELGAFTNIPSSGTYGTLQRSTSKRFEGVGGGWVWESGVSAVDGSLPMPVSGIYVNNTWVPNGSNASGIGTWNIDYRNGQIIFASGTASGTTVKCSYSARDIAVYLADSTEFKTIMTEFARRYDTMGSMQPSGIAEFFKENRVWLPCVVVNVQDAGAEGYQLGGGEIQSFSVFLHVFSDKPFSNKKLGDILRNQFQTTIDLYNPNDAPFALRYNGSLSGSGIEYRDLGTRNSPYFWAYARITDVGGGGYESDLANDLYRSEIRWVVDVQRPVETY